MANPLLEAFQWGAGGAKLTPEEVARQREIASALMQRGNPAFHNAGWLGAIGRGLEGAYAGWSESRANEAESAGRAAYNERLSALFDGAPMASTPPQLGGSPATSTAMATMPAPNSGDLRGGIISTATALGIAPEDLATAISYETAGTFDPTKRGPTTQWGQHRGLIQFGEPQAKQYGVNWDDPLGSQLGPDGAIAKYLRDTGVKPGMGLLDIYSAINAGGVGRYNRSDANNGGAPGTVRDKVEKQMAGHRQKALALLGMNGQTQAPAVAALNALAGGQPSISEGEAQEILSRPRPADAQPYTGPGAVIDPAGVAQLGQERAAQDRAAQRAAMPEWMRTMIPQSADLLSDDQFAARFATTGGPAPEMRDGTQMPGAQEYVAERMAAMAPSLPEPRMVDDLPVADIARSLTGATLADDRVPMAGGASSFAPVGTQAPNVSLPAGAQFTLPPPQQQVAQSLAQGGGQPSMQQLIELASDPWATPAQRQVVGALLQQQMDAADPYRQAQLQKMQLELEQMRNPQAKLINAGDGRLYDPGTGQWIVAPDMGTAKPSEAEARIARLTENLMATGDFLDPREAQNIATGIVDGRLRADRHPITGVLQVVDMATGQPAYQQGSAQPLAGDVMTAPQTTMPSGQFGQQFPNAPGAFGLEGAAQGAINRASDAIGIGPVYPDVAQTQADFAVLRESLLNDMASSYGRQPPSWLLKEIRDLTPEAGSAFQGPAAAQAKLNALGRHLQGELDNTNRALQRDLSPTNRQEMEARQQGLIAGLERVNGAIRAFQPQQQQQQGGAPQPGAVEDGYRFKGGDPADPNNWEPVN